MSFSVYRTLQADGPRKIDGEINEDRGTFKIFGTTVGIGKKFKRPDDWFLGYIGLSYQHYILNRYSAIFNFNEDQGTSNNLSLTGSIQTKFRFLHQYIQLGDQTLNFRLNLHYHILYSMV